MQHYLGYSITYRIRVIIGTTMQAAHAQFYNKPNLPNLAYISCNISNTSNLTFAHGLLPERALQVRDIAVTKETAALEALPNVW